MKADSRLVAETAIDALGDVLSYCRQKALYEADCRVREECRKMRAVLFECDSQKDRVAVVDLARCKRKLKHFRQEVGQTPDELRVMFVPLISELEDKVEQLRVLRRTNSV